MFARTPLVSGIIELNELFVEFQAFEEVADKRGDLVGRFVQCKMSGFQICTSAFGTSPA
jgi:hypothetical protein